MIIDGGRVEVVLRAIQIDHVARHARTQERSAQARRIRVELIDEDVCISEQRIFRSNQFILHCFGHIGTCVRNLDEDRNRIGSWQLEIKGFHARAV